MVFEQKKEVKGGGENAWTITKATQGFSIRDEWKHVQIP